jgi:rhodanese-related sulfurtransferase
MKKNSTTWRVALPLITALMLLLPTAILAGQSPERITVAQVKQLLEKGEKVIFLDSRRGPDWDVSEVKLPDAIRIQDNAALAASIDSLPRDGKIVTYCA